MVGSHSLAWLALGGLASFRVSALELTHVTYDGWVGDNFALLRFISTDCQQCKQLTPAWTKLTAAFEASQTLVVSDIICNKGGKRLCKRFEVEETPSIWYGLKDRLKKYEGETDYESLFNFANNMGVPCGPKDTSNCEEREKKLIGEFTNMLPEERKDLMMAKQKEIKNLEKEFQASVEHIKREYGEIEKQKKAGDIEESVANEQTGELKKQFYDLEAKKLEAIKNIGLTWLEKVDKHVTVKTEL